MRSLAKTIAEIALVAGARAVGDRRVSGRRLVIAWHNIVPDGVVPGGDRSLHLARGGFAAQLDLIARLADVVPLGDLLRHPPSRRPAVALTWDDAYRGAVTEGIAEVRARNLPATMFVAPGILGGRTLWWDALAGTGLDPVRRAMALEQGAGDTEAVRELAGHRGWAWDAMPPASVTAEVSELLAAAGGGITLGAHSWSHPNLLAVDDVRLTDELRRSRDWIREHAPSALDWLAYPYGLHDDRVCAAARHAGFQAAVTISGGWMSVRGPGDLWRIPRFNVPAGLSPAGFELRLRGWLG